MRPRIVTPREVPQIQRERSITVVRVTFVMP